MSNSNLINKNKEIIQLSNNNNEKTLVILIL